MVICTMLCSSIGPNCFHITHLCDWNLQFETYYLLDNLLNLSSTYSGWKTRPSRTANSKKLNSSSLSPSLGKRLFHRACLLNEIAFKPYGFFLVYWFFFLVHQMMRNTKKLRLFRTNWQKLSYGWTWRLNRFKTRTNLCVR